jgi:hypothetical protein
VWEDIAGLPFKDCNHGCLHVWTLWPHPMCMITVCITLSRGLYEYQKSVQLHLRYNLTYATMVHLGCTKTLLNHWRLSTHFQKRNSMRLWYIKDSLHVHRHEHSRSLRTFLWHPSFFIGNPGLVFNVNTEATCVSMTYRALWFWLSRATEHMRQSKFSSSNLIICWV